MDDIYKQSLKLVCDDIGTKAQSNRVYAEEIMGLIQQLLILFLILVNEQKILLSMDLRHGDDSEIKARYN